MTVEVVYDLLKLILEEEFPETYLRFFNCGVLHYELTNILGLCTPITGEREEDDRFLRYEVIGTIAFYLQEI